MDTSKLCRSCMKEVSSWERENFNTRAVEMFCFCTNMKISDDDKLPKQFCYDCIIKIESSFKFITEAQKVDTVLKDIISRTNTSIIDKQQTQNNFELKLKVSDNIGGQILFENKNFLPESDEVDVGKSEAQVNGEKEKKYKNKECGRKKISVGETKKHVCPWCEKEFTSKLWFNKHIDNEHNGPKFVCEHCQKAFSKKWELTQHSVCHTEERKYSCAECGKCFKRRKQLTIHARAHTDVRPFECDKCGMKFKSKDVLKSHLIVHDGGKPFLCYVCGRSFAQGGNLAVHMRQHTGTKPFSCTECDFRATVASTLKCHQRRHRRDRAYVCKECDKGFYDAGGLARHARTHSGARPYECGRCARAFADSWKRKAHLMRAHRLALRHIPRMRRDGRPATPPTGGGTPPTKGEFSDQAR